MRMRTEARVVCPPEGDWTSMKAEIVAIGSELVSGQSLDTNSQWLSRGLAALGVPVRFHTTIGDDLDETIQAFRVAIARADLVVTSGGIGPTQDALPGEAPGGVGGVPRKKAPASLEAIAALLARRNREMPE